MHLDDLIAIAQLNELEAAVTLFVAYQQKEFRQLSFRQDTEQQQPNRGFPRWLDAWRDSDPEDLLASKGRIITRFEDVYDAPGGLVDALGVPAAAIREATVHCLRKLALATIH
ncbi:hypothetical protein D3C72_2196640 [compost metagenome]